MMKRFGLTAAILLGLIPAAGQANPLLRGSFPVPTAALAYAGDCITGAGVCADHVAGQTAIQWIDPVSDASSDSLTTCAQNDAPGRLLRYRLYRSATPINSGNYASATLIASNIYNNSGQAFGGNPDIGGAGATFTQAHRQCQLAVNSMAKITSAQTGLLKTLSFGTGLQHYTALGSANAYYGVVQTDTSDANPVFLGSVGPIAESAAPPQYVQYAHRTTGCGRITSSTTNAAIVFEAHGSSAAGGPATNFTAGDYYLQWGDATQGWQDGAATAFDLYLDGPGGCTIRYPSLSGGPTVVYGNRDTIWSPDGSTAMETWHGWVGMIPNPLVPTTGSVGSGRMYPTTTNKIRAALNWIVANKGADPNQIHMTGESMGAFAGAFVGATLANPTLASVWMAHPVFRFDLSIGSTRWAGATWGTWPFRATVGAVPSTLGLVSSAITMADGTNWLNTRGDFATVVQASPGTDMPFFGGMDTKDDVNLTATGAGSWLQMLGGINAMQDAHRGHCFVFYMGGHTTGSDAMGACNADWTNGADAIGGVAYGKNLFKLNLPYIVFDHSLDNDDPGTATRDATTHIYDGDMVGCFECGHTWNVTSDTVGGVSWTAGDTWMTRSPTVLPSSMLASGITAGSTTISITDTTGWLPTTGGGRNLYFVIGSGGSTEAVLGTLSGNTLSGVSRKQLSGGIDTSQSHNAGDPIVQLVSKPTGPMHGPYTSITTNMTPRRLQNFKPTGAPSCNFTPFGGSPTAATVTYLGNGVFTLTGVTINSGGDTNVSCS